MKKFNDIIPSALSNNACYDFYFDRIKELSMTMYKWEGLPPEIDERFLELELFEKGKIVFFRDDELGEYLVTPVTDMGKLNIYRIPILRRAFAVNGYQRELNIDNSVIIYNNMLRQNSIRDTKIFASRLAKFDRVIDVNVDAQKTPILIRCDERERLTIKNLYMQYDGNMPVIFGDKNLSSKPLECITTEAPFIADKVYDLKVKFWNEMLTFKGISNMNINKKERLVTDEVLRSQGGTIASRYSGLEMRQKACKQINALFGLNVSCNYREDVEGSEVNAPEREEFLNE